MIIRSVFDVQNQSLVTLYTEHCAEVYSVVFSPPGNYIISGSSDCEIRIWDVDTGDTIAGPFTVHTNLMHLSARSPDGNRLASCFADGTIRVSDVRTGEMVLEPLRGHTSSVYQVVYSPDGSCLASCSADGTIRLWDAQTGKNRLGPFAGHTGNVYSVVFSPDGSKLVSGSEDRTVRVWDARTGTMTAGPFGAHTGTVLSVAYSPDGSLFASGSDDGSIRVWDAQSCTTPVSEHLDTWTVDVDGWVVGRGSSRLFWVPGDLRAGLIIPQNVIVIHPNGDCTLDLSNAYIGTEWVKCYVDKRTTTGEHVNWMKIWEELSRITIHRLIVHFSGCSRVVVTKRITAGCIRLAKKRIIF